MILEIELVHTNTRNICNKRNIYTFSSQLHNELHTLKNIKMLSSHDGSGPNQTQPTWASV